MSLSFRLGFIMQFFVGIFLQWREFLSCQRQKDWALTYLFPMFGIVILRWTTQLKPELQGTWGSSAPLSLFQGFLQSRYWGFLYQSCPESLGSYECTSPTSVRTLQSFPSTQSWAASRRLRDTSSPFQIQTALNIRHAPVLLSYSIISLLEGWR